MVRKIAQVSIQTKKWYTITIRALFESFYLQKNGFKQTIWKEKKIKFFSWLTFQMVQIEKLEKVRVIQTLCIDHVVNVIYLNFLE